MSEDNDRDTFYSLYDALQAGKGPALQAAGYAVTGKLRKIIREGIRRSEKSGRPAREEAWEAFQEMQALAGKQARE